MRIAIVQVLILGALVACGDISNKVISVPTKEDNLIDNKVSQETITPTDTTVSTKTMLPKDTQQPTKTIVWSEKPTTVPPDSIIIIRDILYGDSANGERNLLDLYLPNNPIVKYPVILWIHGGGLTTGDKSMARRGTALVKEGFALVSINYRLAPEYYLPTQIYDVKAAVRWVRANSEKYNLDSDNIGVLGGSAGASLAAVLGTSADVEELEGSVGNNLDHSSRVQAVVPLAGVYDLSNFYKHKVDICGSEYVDDHDKCYLRWFLGCSLVEESCWEALDHGSAISHVSRDDPPFFICIGDRDETPHGMEDHTNFHNALLNKGIESTFTIVPGGVHGQCFEKRYNEILDFFTTHLKQ